MMLQALFGSEDEPRDADDGDRQVADYLLKFRFLHRCQFHSTLDFTTDGKAGVLDGVT